MIRKKCISMKIKNLIHILIISVLLCGCANKINNHAITESTSENQSNIENQTQTENEQPSTDEEKDVISTNNQEDAIANSEETILYATTLLESIRETPNKELYRELYALQTSIKNIPDIIKEWNRTEVHSSHSAVLDIMDADTKGFNFQMEAQYYFHTGTISGKAYFVTENCAVYRLDEMETPLSLEDCEYVVFVFEDDCINVYASGNSAEMGLGMNVYVYGTYISEEPKYTNAGILEQTYTEDMLSFIKEQLPDEYYDNLIFATEFGGVNTYEEDGVIIIEAFVPTAGQYNYSVKIKDEAIICILFGDGAEFNF